MKYPCHMIPFGSFMLSQNAATQQAFANSCHRGGRPPFDEMEHINRHIDMWRQMSPSLFMRPHGFSFYADLQKQEWSVLLT